MTLTDYVSALKDAVVAADNATDMVALQDELDKQQAILDAVQAQPSPEFAYLTA